ncbi:hypothetical protein MtrunA17_Chr4g0009691 [Medicago truncatula]|uniref:Uncharacterized protein n=1 Tax=Medicago truncatula TaxID=3880 RepID=A0A396I8D5_MEDTR|nr:hypothetical protein MtrunA17_Chr4g0009691 [Medicago truncatula]
MKGEQEDCSVPCILSCFFLHQLALLENRNKCCSYNTTQTWAL